MVSDIHGKPEFPARMAGWEYQYERAEKAQAESDRRLRLLRTYEAHRKQDKERCFFCAGEWTHASSCALAEEIGND
jgi:hypothetical protein